MTVSLVSTTSSSCQCHDLGPGRVEDREEVGVGEVDLLDTLVDGGVCRHIHEGTHPQEEGTLFSFGKADGGRCSSIWAR